MTGQNFTNIEAEQGVLGCLFYKNELFYDVAEIITAEDFADPVHGEIFLEIRKKIEAGTIATPVTISNAVAARISIQPDYIADIAASILTPINVYDYARQVHELSEKRRLLAVMEQTRIEAAISTPDEMAAKLFAAANKTGRTEVKTTRQVSEAAILSLQTPRISHLTGLDRLDDAMGGGIKGGYLYGIGGAEKRGKTTLGHSISYNLNEQGVKHAYIALEMGSEQIQKRNLARKLGINSIVFDKTKPDAEILKRAARAAITVPDNTLYLDLPGAHWDTIRLQIQKLVWQGRVSGYILDYWQLVRGGVKGQSNADFLFEVAQWLAAFGRKHGVWCILLAQINREGRVFGSAGLEKACDQLYVIDLCEGEGNKTELWINLTHSRYTPPTCLGGPSEPGFIIDYTSGPHIRCI